MVAGRGALLGLRRPLDRSLWLKSSLRSGGCVGGLEIAAMVGAYIAMSSTRAVAVVDGFISAPEPRPVDEDADGGLFADY